MTSSASPSSSPRQASLSFIRTLRGDLVSDESLGRCAAHEHVVMHSPWLNVHFPEFVLADTDRICSELSEFKTAGGGWIVDSMPTGAGRNAAMLEQVSRRSGVPIVCPTGMHQPKYYPTDYPLRTADRDRLVKLFGQEIIVGMNDGSETLALRAGVMKVASSGSRLTAQDREILAAAAIVQNELGCPILTHTEASRDAHEQVAWLAANGACLEQVVLSHCDKNLDPMYHRDLLQSGVCLEYDQHFRQVLRDEPCASVDLIAQLIGDFPRQFLVGMDLARQKYWKSYCGAPGLAWLVTELPNRLLAAGLSTLDLKRIFVTNALHAYSFRLPGTV